MNSPNTAVAAMPSSPAFLLLSDKPVLTENRQRWVEYDGRVIELQLVVERRMWFLWSPVQKVALVLSTLWQGKYSLGKSFWGFFLLGTFFAVIAGMLTGIPFILIDARQTAGVVFQIVFWGYEIIAAVGVWRSANALINIRSGRASVTYDDRVKIFAAKSFVILWLLTNLLRTLGFQSGGQFAGFLSHH